MGKCIIYLADLVHNYASRGPHSFPVNIGYIAAYAKKLYGDKLRIKLFKFPLDLINAIKENRPDIVGLSNYTWSLDINNRITYWVKSLSKDIVTVYGGPDYPVAGEERLTYLKERPYLDFYVINQGEKGFANILERYLQSPALAEMKRGPIENCSFYDNSLDALIAVDTYRYIENLAEIPSPYLSGIMDEFFGESLIPLIETNRGCPYSCIYCAWGNSTQRKVLSFALDRVKQEIEYIAGRVKKTNLLIVGDANFGISERDVEIAQFIKYVKNKYGYPRHMSVGWAKAVPGRIIKIAESLREIVSISASYQTMSPAVMANIKRTNISFQDFRTIQEHFNKKGISTYTELILGLPGETKESHLAGLKTLFDYDTSAIQSYNLRMINGSELCSVANRKQFGIRTKYRLIDGGFGKYDTILSVECEEMVLTTSTMTTEDILYFRPIHFLIQFLWNNNYYKELLYFLKNDGINPVDFITTLLDDKASSLPQVKKIFDEFLDEAYSEWFDSKEELFKYYSEQKNFQLISRGGFGKLNFKYTYRFLIECKDDFDNYLFLTARNILARRGKIDDNKKEQLGQIQEYTKNIFLDLRGNFDKIQNKKALGFKYDILKWKKSAYQLPLSDYRNDRIKLKFSLSDEQIKGWEKLYAQFRAEDMNQTLRKMVECVMNKSDLFYNVSYA